MRAQHTPGPWAYRPQEHDDWGIVRIAYRDENGFQRVICQANYIASPEALSQHRIDGTDPAEANARLIAAAPELLEALEGLIAGLPFAKTESEYELIQGGCDPTEARQLSAAFSAIAKARGNP